jgi:hypothetical protein
MEKAETFYFLNAAADKEAKRNDWLLGRKCAKCSALLGIARLQSDHTAKNKAVWPPNSLISVPCAKCGDQQGYPPDTFSWIRIQPVN